MGRIYAGILGLLSFATVVARGVISGGSIESILKTACCCLFVFAALGYVLGQIAASIVKEAVQAKFPDRSEPQIPTAANDRTPAPNTLETPLKQ